VPRAARSQPTRLTRTPPRQSGHCNANVRFGWLPLAGPSSRAGHSEGSAVTPQFNLYSITTKQAAIAALFRVVNRYVGNLPPMPGIFPDYPAPVVRNSGGEREMTMMRWGMPPPPRTDGPPVTNIRNTFSPHWRGWLKPENRGLVRAR
jgi:hypothetical protein